MQLSVSLLDALESVLRTGSFEVAAEDLGVTVSALSQRIRQLEERIGAVLVVRGSPCRGTTKGLQLYHHAQLIALQEQSLLKRLGAESEDHHVTISIALNADTLATWFLPAMVNIDRVLLRLSIDDTASGTGMLSRGEAIAAVTINAREVAGCDIFPLGILRYMPVARPDFIERWFPKGITPETIARAPAITYDEKDRLQINWAESICGGKAVPPTHIVSTADGMRLAALAGLGWLLLPLPMVASDLAKGRLKLLTEKNPIDVPLTWQVSRSMRKIMAPITKAVRNAAQTALLPMGAMPTRDAEDGNTSTLGEAV